MKNTDLIFGLMASLGKDEYTVADLLYLIQPFQVSETSLRTNLSRMSQRKWVQSRRQGKTVFYRFSPKGRSISVNVAKSFHTLDWTGWNDTWWGVLFSVPELQKEARYRIRVKLAYYRFASLYAGTWIRPFHEAEHMETHLQKIAKNPHCKMIRFRCSGAITKKDVARLWKLTDIHREFKEALTVLSQSGKKLSTLTPERAFVEGMHTSSRIVDILFKDPLLPDCFLPSGWKGRELKQRFKEYNRIVQNRSKPFWMKIFEQ
jgi:phenylacetic acid degradation operon negative regulatory protein